MPAAAASGLLARVGDVFVPVAVLHHAAPILPRCPRRPVELGNPCAPSPNLLACSVRAWRTTRVGGDGERASKRERGEEARACMHARSLRRDGLAVHRHAHSVDRPKHGSGSEPCKPKAKTPAKTPAKTLAGAGTGQDGGRCVGSMRMRCGWGSTCRQRRTARSQQRRRHRCCGN